MLSIRAELAAAVLFFAASAGDSWAQAAPSRTDPIGAVVAEAVQRFGMPEVWIRAVMRRESGDDPTATSPKGAMGLMQLMPDTWAQLRLQLGLGADPYDVRDNVLAGAAYLRELYDEFGPAGVLAAYNAGPRRYLDYVSRGRPLPVETRAYVTAVSALLRVPTAMGPTSAPRGASPKSAPRSAPPSVFVCLDGFASSEHGRATLFANLPAQ